MKKLMVMAVILWGAAFALLLSQALDLVHDPIVVFSCTFFTIGLVIWLFIAYSSQHDLDWKQLAYQDELTGLLNRRGLRANAIDGEYCCIVIDIDNFKLLNDQQGHATGDAILVHLASRLKHNTREQDLCIRWGGDEFVIVLFNACSKVGQLFIKRLHNDLKINPYIQPFTITAGWVDNQDMKDIYAAINKADEILLFEKQKIK